MSPLLKPAWRFQGFKTYYVVKLHLSHRQVAFFDEASAIFFNKVSDKSKIADFTFAVYVYDRSAGTLEPSASVVKTDAIKEIFQALCRRMFINLTAQIREEHECVETRSIDMWCDVWKCSICSPWKCGGTVWTQSVMDSKRNQGNNWILYI